MLASLIDTIRTLFQGNGKGPLESYITNRDPKTSADVEYLTREYERKVTRESSPL